MDLAFYNVTSIEIHFNTAILLPGGKLASSILNIEFETAIAWTTFEETWLQSDAVFDLTTLTFTTSDASKAALKNILGLSLMAVEAPRHVAVGSDGADTIALTGSGDWVVYGNGGDDAITLADGDDEVIYLVDDDGSALTASDGSDTVTDFDLGSDKLTFIDSNGAAPTLAELLGRMTSVALDYDASNGYEGITFTMGATALAIDFETALDATELKTALGGGDGGTALTDAELDAAFSSGGAPTATGTATLSTAGLGYIDDLFGACIEVSTLPTELL